MNVTLTPQLEELVREKVEAGLYGSPEEVFAEALHLLDKRDKKLAALRRDIEEGLASGPSAPLDIEAIIARGYERLAREQRSEGT